MSNIPYTEYCRRNFHWQTEFNNIKGKVIPMKTNKQTHFRLCKVHHGADIVAVCLCYSNHIQKPHFLIMQEKGDYQSSLEETSHII